MVETNQFHSILLKWVQTLLFLLLIVLHHGADAQSTMQPEPTFAAHHNWDPSTALMIGALICAFLFMGFISIYVRHCAESYVTGRNGRAASSAAAAAAAADRPCSKGIDRETLATFPIIFYSTVKDLKIGNGALECAVCLSDFKDHETLRLLPKCNHVFHPDCIDQWLSSHVTCPVCRAKLNKNLGEVAIPVPSTTDLRADQVYEESSGSGAERCGGEYEEIERRPVARNAKEGERHGEEGEGKRNAASKSNLFGKFQRSNSTGHSLDDPGKCMERYTLRLPEDVRRYILLNHGMIQRSESCYSNVALPLVGSSREGIFGSDSEGSSGGKGNDADLKQWMVLLMQPLVERHG